MKVRDYEQKLSRALHEFTPEPPPPRRLDELIDIGAATVLSLPPADRPATRMPAVRRILAGGLAACAVVAVAVVPIVEYVARHHQQPTATPVLSQPAATSGLARACDSSQVRAALAIQDDPVRIEITLRNEGMQSCRLTAPPVIEIFGPEFRFTPTFRPGIPALPGKLAGGQRARFRLLVATVPGKASPVTWVVRVKLAPDTSWQNLTPHTVPDQAFSPTAVTYLGN